MVIRVADTAKPERITLSQDKLANFLDGLAHNYRRHAEWIAEINTVLIFGQQPQGKLEINLKECTLCRFFDDVGISEIQQNYNYIKLITKHKIIHQYVDELIRSSDKDQLSKGEYEIFKRAYVRQAYLVDQLRQLSAFSIAHVDELTQLLTRDVMDQYLEIEYERAKRIGIIFSIAMMDIDHFKKINDEYGHQAGDMILHNLAILIESSLRPYDEAFRYGGEEFLLLLPETNTDDAVKILERLREQIEAEIAFTGGEKVQVTASFGVGQFSPDLELKDIIELADQKLYEAKSNGRNRVVV